MRPDAVIRRLNASMDDQNQMLADGDEQALAARERARMFGQGTPQPHVDARLSNAVQPTFLPAVCQ